MCFPFNPLPGCCWPEENSEMASVRKNKLTARFLGQSVAGKTVVLTGAMVPYKFGSSDGLFNLGSALALAQVLPAGVYVAMNGRFFAWNVVTKNREIGAFEYKKPRSRPVRRPGRRRA
jgi:L-asparaginase/Glu-tRNA(Gln) amidotransferase subunit D